MSNENTIEHAVLGEMARTAGLEELGFKVDESGQLIAEGCRVTFYSSCGEWEVDIVLPNGSSVGFDVAFSAVKRSAAPTSQGRQAGVAGGDVETH